MTGYLLTKIATQLAYPLSISSALSLLGLVLPARRRTRLGAASLSAARVVLWVASTPVVAYLLLDSLESRYAPVAAAAAPNASAIVLLGGALSSPMPPRSWMDLNEAADRIVHAARLYRAGKAPVVIASGGRAWRPPSVPSPAEATADLLAEWGLPRAAILTEDDSVDTYGNAILTKRVLDAHGIHGPVLLVTSAAHMWRAKALFESAGVEVIPAPTDFTLNGLDLRVVLAWIPDAGALRGTSAALKEYLGVLVARLRGQIAGGAG